MILCCGEALIDMIPTRGEDGRAAFAPHTGGAVFNTAIALGRLGASVALFSGLSRDMFGARLRAGLVESHVRTEYIAWSERPSTLAFVEMTEGQARYSFFDEGSAGRMLALSDIPEIGEEITALFFGGISLACEPCAETYAALLAREGAGRAVMLDPNIRAGFIDDATRYRARLDAMLGACDILKLSDEDLSWIDPSDATLDEKAAPLFQRGPSVVIVTHGAGGAVGYLRGGGKARVPAQAGDVVDTVGAGDTFNAGVLAALSERGGLSKGGLKALSQAGLAEALSLGAHAAAVTVSRVGAAPPWRHELP